MFLSYIFALPARGKRLLANGTSGMRFQEHRLTRQFLFGFCRPLANAHGRATYWLNTALVLLVICSTVAVLYLTSGIGNDLNQPNILLEQKEVNSPAPLYRIPMPEKKSVQPDPGFSSDTVAREVPA